MRRSPPAFLALQALKKRTLTNPYGARPQRHADAHGAVDAVVAAAQGWPAEISAEDFLPELLALNRGERRASGGDDGGPR